jgi:pyruvate ferredoxin oxidoreductase beta subunit
MQGRYAHLLSPARRDDVIAAIQAIADRTIARYDLLGDRQEFR